MSDDDFELLSEPPAAGDEDGEDDGEERQAQAQAEARLEAPIDVPIDEPPARVHRPSLVPPAPPGGPLPDVEGSEARAPRPDSPPTIIAFGGARGGVGKSVLAANVGLYLSTIGRSVALVDADPGGANLHTCLGTRPPARTGSRRSMRPPANDGEGLHDTAFRGLRLMQLGLDEPLSAAARAERLAKMPAHLSAIEAEYVVADLGVGLARELLDAYLDADVAVFVTAPEPTAIENTYTFLRGAFARFLLRSVGEGDARGELEKRLRAQGGAPAPLDWLHELEAQDDPLAEPVREALTRFRPRIVVNQTRLRTDVQLGASMVSAVRRRLGITIDYLGYIDHDDAVWLCSRNRKPLLLEVPGARSSRKIEKLARRVLTASTSNEAPATVEIPGDSHHDLLEIERGATEEEIRRAYKRCREVYAPEALCCYGLFEPHEIEEIRARLDEAFDVLLDPARRRPYEKQVFPDPLPEQIAKETVLDDRPVPPAPDITTDTQFTGPLLRRVRESQRISLRDISRRTKINVVHLKAIEEDDFAKLPPLVYANGFVTELARYLKLEPQLVARSYVGRYKRYLDDKARGFAR